METRLAPLKGLRPLLCDADPRLLLYRQGRLLETRDHGRSFSTIARFPRSLLERLCEPFDLVRRLLRLGCHEVVRLADGALLGSVRGHLVRLEPGGDRFVPVFKLPRGSRPLRLCVTPGGWIYFGEYFANPERGAVDIYGSCDGGRSWRSVYRFGPGEIRHVHGVFYDPYRNGCWVCTGDDDAECRILFTRDDFGHLDVRAAGSQQVRSVIMIPRPEGVVTATDTPFEQNFIHWLDPKTGELRQVQAVEGSVLYGTSTRDFLVLSTIVEPSKVNLCREACIWFSRDGLIWRRLAAVAQDRYAGRFFQYGAFLFPRGQRSDNLLYAYGQSLQTGSGLYGWDLDREWAERP